MLKRADIRLLRALRTRGHQPAAETGMRGLAHAGEWGAVWVTLGLGASQLDSARREPWLRAAAIAPIAVLINYVVKLLARRPRPKLDDLPRLGSVSSELSFPSAHATSSFAAAVAFARVAPPVAPATLTLASMICLTRPYLGMHYPSDVLAGAVLGTAIGLAWPGLTTPAGTDLDEVTIR